MSRISSSLPEVPGFRGPIPWEVFIRTCFAKVIVTSTTHRSAVAAPHSCQPEQQADTGSTPPLHRCLLCGAAVDQEEEPSQLRRRDGLKTCVVDARNTTAALFVYVQAAAPPSPTASGTAADDTDAHPRAPQGCRCATCQAASGGSLCPRCRLPCLLIHNPARRSRESVSGPSHPRRGGPVPPSTASGSRGSLLHGGWIAPERHVSRQFVAHCPYLQACFACLHPAEAAYLLAHCAVVTQRCPGEGALHVFGCDLKATAPHFRKSFRRPLPAVAKDFFGGPPRRKGRRVEGPPPQGRALSAIPMHEQARRAAIDEALQLPLPRRHLTGWTPQRERMAPLVAWLRSLLSAPPVPRCAQGQYSAEAVRAAVAAAEPTLPPHVTKLVFSRSAAIAAALSHSRTTQKQPAGSLRNNRVQAGGVGDDRRDKVHADRDAPEHAFDAFDAFARHILCVLGGQLVHANVRGEVLRLTAAIEARFGLLPPARRAAPDHRNHEQGEGSPKTLEGDRVQHADERTEGGREKDGTSASRAPQTPPDVSDAVVLPSLVVAFVMRLIGPLLYLPPPKAQCDMVAGDATAIPESRRGVLGRGPVSAAGGSLPTQFWGGKDNLAALEAFLVRWLSLDVEHAASDGRPFRAAHGLAGLQLSLVPWLQGTRTVQHTRRSQVQQALMAEVLHLLVLAVVPALCTEAFHFTVSARQRSALVIIPRRVWLSIVRSTTAAHVHGGTRAVRVGTEDGKGPQAAEVQKEPALTVLGLVPATPRDVWRRRDRLTSVLAPSGLLPPVPYASLRLLPDRTKLRPISTIRAATAGSLSATILRPSKGDQGRHKHQGRGSPTVPQPSSSSSRRAPAMDRPNQGILRQALRCLAAGSARRRQELSLPDFVSNRVHEDEYVEWVAFKQRVEAAGALKVFFVRGDARRCYDALPQAAVSAAIQTAVSSDRYFAVTFTCVAGGGGDVRSMATRRPWESVVAEDDLRRGVVRGIPRGWIAEENGAPLVPKTVYAAATGGPTLPLSAWQHTPWREDNGPAEGQDGLRGGISHMDTVAAPRARAYPFLSGPVVRRVLEAHTRHHFVLLGGRVFRQTVGIPQGSAVSQMLCDLLYAEVDVALCERLACHPSDAHLVLRRVDDVIVATTSAIAALEVRADLVRGWPHVGFFCAPEKLLCTAAPPSSQSLASAPSGDANGATNTAPWCGTAIHADLSMSVSWERLIESSARRQFGASHAPGDWLVVMGALQVASMLRMRMPIGVLCGVLNAPERALQTCCEAALLWAAALVSLLATASLAARPHPRLLLRPLRASIHHMVSHICGQQHRELRLRGSSCPLRPRDVAWCFSRAAADQLPRLVPTGPHAPVRPPPLQVGRVPVPCRYSRWLLAVFRGLIAARLASADERCTTGDTAVAALGSAAAREVAFAAAVCALRSP